MTDFRFIDSSVWIAYLFEGRFVEEIENDIDLFISVISLFEIKIKLLKQKVSTKDISQKLDYIKKRCSIISIDENLSEKAAELAIEHHLGAADSLIYASSLENNAELITLDNDFRGLNKVSLRN